MRIRRVLFMAVFCFLSAAFLEALPQPRVAVVLSGGSALGLAHVGVLEVLEREGIPVDMILGTSMGSIVGGLYAAGYSPEQMETIVTRIDWSTVFTERRDSPGDRYDWLKSQRFPLRLGFDSQGLNLGAGLLEGQNVLALFTELTLHDLTVRSFDDLPVPYRAVAADIVTGEKVVFSRGSIAEAMRSSMSIPGIFRPYEIQGRKVVDGGIVDNMPVDVARDMGADIIIAVECRMGGAQSAESLKSGIDITAQTLNLFISQNMAEARKQADVVITPDLHEYNLMSYADAAQIVQRGRDGAEAMLPRIRELAARIEKSRPLVAPQDQANRKAMRPLPELTGVRAEGGNPSDQAQVRQTFAPLIGKPADRTAVRAAIDSLYSTGRFELVMLDLEPAADSTAEAPQAVAIVRLSPDATAESALLLSQSFRSLFSTITDSVTQFSGGALIRGVTTKDSALFAEVGLLDKRRVAAEFFQPAGPFFVEPFFRYESQFDGYFITRTDVIQTLYQSVGGGAWAGITLNKHADLMAGYSYEAVTAYGFLDSDANTTLGMLSAVLRVDTFGTSVFPTSGFSTTLRGRWADAVLGGNTGFTALEWNVNAALPLSGIFTLGAAGYAATDFTGFFNVNGSIPAERAFTIRQPGMFYGLEPLPATGTGNHVAALALELRALLGTLSPLLGIDLYGLANVSVAAVRQGLPADVDFTDFLPLRWNGSLGIGARLTDRAGVMAVISYVNDGNTALSPQRFAFTLEAGTFALFLDDRR